ncbi:MAG: tRNA epoxyqueuosine(34) reductase QueG, partial [Bdellovibrionota bacterium]
MQFQLHPEIKKLFPQEASVFSFAHQNSNLKMDFAAFEEWISQGAQAQMSFLEKNFEARKNPSFILENVSTAIVFLFPYSHGNKVRARLGNINNKNSNINKNSLITKKLISKYVYGKDYHKTLKAKLNFYASKLKELLKEDFDYRPVVDSIPFFDRAHAREAGLGFVGKNTMLIRPGMGSFFFIATLLTSLPIEKLATKILKKNPLANLDCGTCTKCLDACPTGALEKNYFLNANKCLSYLSIEHRDIVDPQYIPYFKDTLYGCDICQDVCPYNAVTLDSHMISEFAEYHAPFTLISAEQIATMTQKQYELWFGGTAATRAKYEGLVRNALYHLYSVGHEKIGEICEKLLG